MSVHRLITVFACMMLLTGTPFAQSSPYKEILFFGILGENSPGVCQTFEKIVRNRLAGESGVRITDYAKTITYREKIEFFRYPVVSTENLARLRKMLPDSLLFCWGKITTTDVKPIRKNWIQSAIRGKMAATIIIYDPEQKRFLFNGDVSAEKVYPGSTIFCSAPEKMETVTAGQRTAILDELMNQVASKSQSLLAALMQYNQSGGSIQKQEDNTSGTAPSISDVFSVPSVEPPRIRESDGTDAAAPGKTGGNTRSTNTK